MRTFKVFAILLVLSKFCVAQETFDNYENKLYGKQFKILISSEKPEKYQLYIDIISMDKIHDRAGIILDQKSHPKFLEALKYANNKFAEWLEVAKANDVEELKKDIDVKCSMKAYFGYGDWQFDDYVTPTFSFFVYKDNGKIIRTLSVTTGELHSNTNRFMDVDGGAFIFQDPEDVEEFIAKIEITKISEFLAKPKKTDLFK